MLCLGRWELYFMLECFDVYRERLHASLLYALFPETIKLCSWIINFVSPLEAVPECSFQSAILRAFHNRDAQRAQTNLVQPGRRDSTETETELCLSISYGGTGQQWAAAGAGALGAADLNMA